jgi:hypothetical protein
MYEPIDWVKKEHFLPHIIYLMIKNANLKLIEAAAVSLEALYFIKYKQIASFPPQSLVDCLMKKGCGKLDRTDRKTVIQGQCKSSKINLISFRSSDWESKDTNNSKILTTQQVVQLLKKGPYVYRSGLFFPKNYKEEF